MVDDEQPSVGLRWAIREALFVILGMILWRMFGWRVLWGAIPVALVAYLLYFRRYARSRPGE